MSELEAVIAEEKAKLVESKKLRMLYLDEEDMIEAGVMDAAKCVDVMEETMGLLEDGDFITVIGGNGAGKQCSGKKLCTTFRR